MRRICLSSARCSAESDGSFVHTPPDRAMCALCPSSLSAGCPLNVAFPQAGTRSAARGRNPVPEGLRIPRYPSRLLANNAFDSNRVAVPSSRALNRITAANGVAYRSK
jgi:hypothetical protein